MKKKNKVEFKCVLKDVLDIVGGKWSIPIIYVLFEGTKRFKELERNIPNINTRMLVKELKKLEAANVISRKAYPTVPSTVEYSLTVKGKKLQPIILELYKWGEEYFTLRG
ncbi:MarR family transcriptional regulator [Elizabethkingia anophelis]|nr:MarR family transcriptional regulator [Elizabethkingia anophelis]MDV3842091.1 MarR family transcriptional regulator [Elizabethkingia anophelis]